MNETRSLPFDVKICGITRGEDVHAAVEAGANAIGLNFYPGSRRYLAEVAEAEILAAVNSLTDAFHDKPQVIGVFVNSTVEEILERARRCSLDWIQLHGDEGPDFGRHLTGHRILRALPYGPEGLAGVRRYLEQMIAAGCLPDAILLDTHQAGQFGGTGRVLPWTRLQSELAEGPDLPVPWVLAGGLGPTNVAEAVSKLRPAAVDVASGVEVGPGQKDPQKIRQFVRAARSAWAF